MKISHLQYANDTVIVCPPKMESLQNVKKTLILFHLASGLQVNFYKSSIMGLNVTDKWLDDAAKNLLCKKGSLPFMYLGLPIGGSSSAISSWDPVIRKMENKLATWRGRLLSIGGCLTLIKSSMSSLPLYYMSLFPVPQGVIKKITAIQRQFLWSGSLDKNSMSLVKWETIQLPKNLGGLSIGNLLHKNISLLFKWIWRFFCEPKSLWRSVISEKYKYSSSFRIADLQIPKAGGPWRSICAKILKNSNAKSIAMNGIRYKVENGKTALFWHDIWIGDSSLKILFPRLFSIAASKNVTIESLGFWNGWSWVWAFAWSRSLRIRDSIEYSSLQSLLGKVCISIDNDDEII